MVFNLGVSIVGIIGNIRDRMGVLTASKEHLTLSTVSLSPVDLKDEASEIN